MALIGPNQMNRRSIRFPSFPLQRTASYFPHGVTLWLMKCFTELGGEIYCDRVSARHTHTHTDMYVRTELALFLSYDYLGQGFNEVLKTFLRDSGGIKLRPTVL